MAWSLGIAQAARIYFDKSPEELTDIECSFLAGIPTNPGRYNPLGKPADVARRRSIVRKGWLRWVFCRPSQLRQQISHRQRRSPPTEPLVSGTGTGKTG